MALFLPPAIVELVVSALVWLLLPPAIVEYCPAIVLDLPPAIVLHVPELTCVVPPSTDPPAAVAPRHAALASKEILPPVTLKAAFIVWVVENLLSL